MNKQWQVKDSSPSPKWLLNMFKDYFDPCPLDDNPKFNGLEIPWKEYNYVNPPWSDKVPWIKKAIKEMHLGNTTVMLLPHVPEMAWYHDLVVPNAEILSFRGRLELDNGKHGRYGTMLAIFHADSSHQMT